MKEILVTTMPIKPRTETNIGMLIAPTVSSFIAEKFECTNVLATNLLHSYQDNGDCCELFFNDAKNFGLDCHERFVDKEHEDKLQKYVDILVSKGIIVESDVHVLRCECGKVDILRSGVRDFENGDLYNWNGDTIYCNSCNTRCLSYFEKQLVLQLDSNIDDKVNIAPLCLESRFKSLTKNVKGQAILISKKRKTDYSITIGTHIYNIDIDLLWMNYNQCFEEKNQIVVASNHQLYEMYIINYINKMAFDKRLYFVATPYMKKTSLNLPHLFDRYDDDIYKKLCVLYSLKWGNLNCNWSESIFTYLAKLGGDKRKFLYEYLIMGKLPKDFDINEILDEIFMRQINFQENQKILKRGGLSV